MDGMTGTPGKYFALSVSIGPMIAGSSGGVLASGLSLRASSIEMAGLPMMPASRSLISAGVCPGKMR